MGNREGFSSRGDEDGFGFCLKVPGIGQGVEICGCGEQGEEQLFIFNFLAFSFPADSESFGGSGEADVIRPNAL